MWSYQARLLLPFRSSVPTSKVRAETSVSASSSCQKRLVDFPELPMTMGLEPKTSERAPWGKEVERFLAWKQAETSAGNDWIRRMRWELLRVPTLLNRVGATPSVLEPGQVSDENIRCLRQSMGWSRATFGVHFAALRQFLRWAGNPVAARNRLWCLPPGEPSRRRWLTKEQLVILYNSTSGPARILVGLEGLNGLRRVEVLRLRVKDVMTDEETLHVRGKGGSGGKWRKIPLHPALRRDLNSRIQESNPDDPIVSLSRSGADLALARAVRVARLGVGVRVSHHDLRRTFGRLAHEAGMDLVQLKNLLGHSSLQMTEHYIGLDSTRMREGLGKFTQYLGGSTAGSVPGSP